MNNNYIQCILYTHVLYYIIYTCTSVTPYQENVSLPRDMSEHANQYLFDPVLMQLLKKYGPWLTKVRERVQYIYIDAR